MADYTKLIPAPRQSGVIFPVSIKKAGAVPPRAAPTGCVGAGI